MLRSVYREEEVTASEHVQWQSTINGDDRCYGYGLTVEQFLGERLLVLYRS